MKVVLSMIEADPTSDFYYQLIESSLQTELFLIEHNSQEKYTIIHYFFSDLFDREYVYESMPLSKIQLMYNMIHDISVT